MWKRDEAVKSPSGAAAPPAYGPMMAESSVHSTETRHHMDKGIVHIGKSVVIKGELNGSEDLTIEGQIEGTIQLREHVLTIGPHAQIKAQVFAKAVIVLGAVIGKVTATDKVEIQDSGSVDGDIVASRVAISESAHFRGTVDMQRKTTPAKAETKPVAVAPLAQPTPVAAVRASA